MRTFLFSIMCLISFLCCKHKIDQTKVSIEDLQEPILESIEVDGTNLKSRFVPPEGYSRAKIEANSFAHYLRNFPLLGPDTKVHLYNGQLKGNQDVHAAVFDIDVGDRDLQQCADAIMRLRSEYLLAQNMYDDIAFNFTNGWRFQYSKWRDGNDLVVQGNETKWKSGSGPKESYQDFRKYLDHVFMYAGTLSLSKELIPKKLNEIEIGDVFIYGGSPGHAVIVVDLAIHENGDKAFMLAQSYMPAQQIHVLKNPVNTGTSPWYLVSEIESSLVTPEWTFVASSLAGFSSKTVEKI